jgi:hypothetical protein
MSGSLTWPWKRPATNLVGVGHEDGTMNETAGRRRRCRQARHWQAGLLAVTAGLALATAACSSSASGSGVPAHGGSAASGSAADMLAYAQCVRAHGVPDWPDPGANGQEPASTKNLVSDPHFTAANNACRHLAQGGSSVQFAADTRQYVQFAQCVRAHGVPNFPDPSTDPDGSPVFNLGNSGVNVQSPQVQTAALGCQRRLHLTKLPNYRT